MDDAKAQLLRWIDEDREEIVSFLCDFVRAKSPNPPGDTTLAAAHVTRFLTLNQLPFRVIAPQATMPNVVGSFEGARPGHHLVLNGHMDVFPADEANERWTHGPWSGAIAEGKIYGRGVAVADALAGAVMRHQDRLASILRSGEAELNEAGGAARRAPEPVD